MSEEEDDLPSITLSPFKIKVKKIPAYKMPKANDLAAKRRVEEEQEEIASLIIKKEITTIDYDMPDAEEIAIKRRDSDEQNVIIENLLKSLNHCISDLDKELPDNIMQSELNVQNMNIFSDCPGIDIDQIEFNNLNNVLSPLHTMFISNVISEINSCVDENLDNTITAFFNVMHENVLNTSILLKFEDTLCYILLFCAILLDKRCRNIYTLVDLCEILWGLLRKVPPPLQSTNFLDIVSDKILSKFTHFHDRLYIAECLERIKCNPSELDTNPLYFSTRLAKHILLKSLCDLVGYKVNKKSKIMTNNFMNLKKIVMTGKNTYALEPYQQYILIKTLNMLNSMVIVDESADEIIAKKWFLTFFNTMKCNQPQRNAFNADFIKVKVLCACTKLLWCEQCEEIDKASNSEEKC